MYKFSLALLAILFLFLSCAEDRENLNRDVNFVEISSWWTAEGENEALTVLQNQFSKKFPGYNIVNSYMAGGSGAVARKILSERLQGGTPPDSFQVLVGEGLIQSNVKIGQLEPLTFLYDELGWKENISQEIVDALTFEGDQYAVPLNIHRSNLIWYKPEIFEKYNISPLKNMDDLIQACEILSENGMTPISLGDKLGWTSLHIFENILLSLLGPDDYLKLWKGEISFLSDPILRSIDYYIRIIEFSNSDHKALSWDEAIWNVAQGNCGISIVGDWADSYLNSKGFERNVDYSWSVFPGTEGIYHWLSDGFSLPKGAINREAALKWLELCGSVSAQEEFNYNKSSIPPRLDVDQSRFSTYQKSAYIDFSRDILIGSVNHGVLVSDEVWFLLLDIINDLVVHKNRNRAQNELEGLRYEYLLK